jgi:hypothetical protein
MLLFRDEGHAGRWGKQWRLPAGAILTLDAAWRLSRAWFGEIAARRSGGDRRSIEVESLFRSLGFTSPFWSVG